MESHQFINGSFTWRELVMLIGVLATLLVGLWNVLINYTKNKKELFVNAITTERVKWMSKLRELSSEYISLTKIHNHKEAFEKDLTKRAQYLDKIVRVSSELKLHLNYKDDSDNEIITIMDEISSHVFELYDVIDLLKMTDEEKLKVLTEPSNKPFMKEMYLKALREVAKKEKIIEWDETKLIKKAPRLHSETNKQLNELFKKRYGYEGQTTLMKNIENFSSLLRVYLKNEWERVKAEAEKGNLKQHRNKTINKNSVISKISAVIAIILLTYLSSNMLDRFPDENNINSLKLYQYYLLTLYGLLIGVLLEFKSIKGIIRGHVKISWTLFPSIILLVIVLIPDYLWVTWYGKDGPWYINPLLYPGTQMSLDIIVGVLLARSFAMRN
ncbi:hypothetical protein GMD78_13095 [Ornithinibacillus sp. L9]|uniref:Uncharacterized protein n=1 Tax=Ornithinibacillus caprae TaxID=2678566 RepID=A0A6N8FPB6_9BACI|nr:hypothetical protein [Ornithinibacillus caprae]MUK89308.1 hypothetical protein [Ornithinibacillus caprae]